MKNETFVSVVVPCFNEAKNIEKTYKTLRNAFKKNFIKKFQIVFIDDKSNDETLKKLKNIKIKDKKIIILKNKINLGLGGSLNKGFAKSIGNYIMWMPGDNAHSLKDINNILKKIKMEKFDIIIPTNDKSKRSLVREVFSKGYTILLNIIFYKKIKYYNGAVVYNKKILKKINRSISSKSHFFLAETLIRAMNIKCNYCYLSCSVRKQNVSNAISIKSLISIFIDILKLKIKLL